MDWAPWSCLRSRWVLAFRRSPSPVDYESILTAEGMPAELRVGADWGRGYATRFQRERANAEAYYSVTDDYLWSCDWNEYPAVHRATWERHCAGASHREVSAALRLNPNKVRAIVYFHRMRAGIRVPPKTRLLLARQSAAAISRIDGRRR